MCLEAARRLHSMQGSRRHQEAWLEAVRGVPAEAGYALAMVDRLPESVLALERGRAILMSEALQLRGRDLEDLSARGHADLGDRFRRLAEELQNFDHPGEELSDFAPAEPLPKARADLRAELDATIATIRRLPGFEGFLAPTEMADVA